MFSPSILLANSCETWLKRVLSSVGFRSSLAFMTLGQLRLAITKDSYIFRTLDGQVEGWNNTKSVVLTVDRVSGELQVNGTHHGRTGKRGVAEKD